MLAAEICMPSKFKKLVHERQAKTGERYQTAARQIRTQCSATFEATLLHIIALAKLRREAVNARVHQRINGGTEQARTRPPSEDALLSALLSSSLTDVRKLLVLMYSGREGTSRHSHIMPCDVKDHLTMACILDEKLPLDRYLEDGLELARKQGLDLESDFAPTPRRNKSTF